MLYEVITHLEPRQGGQRAVPREERVHPPEDQEVHSGVDGEEGEKEEA